MYAIRSYYDSPFDWKHQTGAPVTGTVRQGAVKDGQQTPYKYDVQVGEKTLDPKIIEFFEEPDRYRLK